MEDDWELVFFWRDRPYAVTRRALLPSNQVRVTQGREVTVLQLWKESDQLHSKVLEQSVNPSNGTRYVAHEVLADEGVTFAFPSDFVRRASRVFRNNPRVYLALMNHEPAVLVTALLAAKIRTGLLNDPAEQQRQHMQQTKLQRYLQLLQAEQAHRDLD